MRRILGPLLVMVLLGVGAGLFLWSQTTTTPASAPAPVPALQPDAAAPLTMPADATPATVNYVHDGDTIFLTTPADPNLKVRLLAVDTPEIGDNPECYGDAATAYTRTLLPEGATVYTAADASPLDQYGRSLLFVWTADGTLVNYALVSGGYAEAVFIGDNRLYEAEFEAAEGEAMDAGVGVWGSC